MEAENKRQMKNLETPVIVVDATTFQPMSWGGEQFLFVPPVKINSVRRTGFGVKAYRRCDARLLIKADRAYRLKNRLTVTHFAFVLVDPRSYPLKP